MHKFERFNGSVKQFPGGVFGNGVLASEIVQVLWSRNKTT